MEFNLLGYITGSFGLDGTLRVLSKTQFAAYRYKKGNKVFLYNAKTEERCEAIVESYRSSGQFDYVKLDRINTKEEADALKSVEIQVEKISDELEEGYYFFSDLVGCEVFDENEKRYGIVKEVEEFPAQITLRVKQESGKEFFIPFIQNVFIKSVDIKAKKIIFIYMEGML